MTKKVDNSSNRPENIINEMLEYVGIYSLLKSTKHPDEDKPGGMIRVIQKMNPMLYEKILTITGDSFDNVRVDDIIRNITPGKSLSQLVKEHKEGMSGKTN